MGSTTTRRPLPANICSWLFHYGVYDLPLPCRFHMTPEIPVRTNIASLQDMKKIYETVEFLPNDTMAVTPNASLMNASSTMSMDSADVDFSNLYPAVVECFAIILCGYLAGRGNLISQTESKGLNVFVGTFSLPPLIFMSMAKLDFSAVNWIFLSSICLSKTIVFLLVAIITLLVYRPMDFGRAGLFAIFCTQSNDFALGYPIVAALYGKAHPEYASYLYLAAPISLVFLNPIGFILMEINRRRNSERELNGADCGVSKESKCRMFANIAKELASNPFVFMTALGIAGNFIFDHQLPNILEGILKVLAQAFSASALFLLGLSMVGKVQNLRGSGLVTPSILIAVKTLILPLVTREIVSLLKPGLDANATMDFSNYGFLYGTFPTAPGVFVFSSKYDIAVDMIASAMVACTFLSAPLMFISAKMVTLVTVNPFDYIMELETFLFDVSIVGLVGSLWVILAFCLTRKWGKIPHFVTLCLTVSQCVACVGAILWAVIDHKHAWKSYLQFLLFSFGVFSTRVFTALLAVSLFLLRWKSLAFMLSIRPYLAAIGWGIPTVLVSVLVLMVQEERSLAHKHDPNFQYGSTQAVIALLLLSVCLLTTMICLILHQRFEKKYGHYDSLFNAEDPQGQSPLLGAYSSGSSPEISPGGSPQTSSRVSLFNSVSQNSAPSIHSIDSVETLNNTVSVDVNEDSDSASLFSYRDQLPASPPTSRARSPLSPCGTFSSGSGNGMVVSPTTTSSRTTVRASMGTRRTGRGALTEPEEAFLLRDRDDEYQMLRHVVLLLLLCGSMIVGFALCMWTLVSPQVNGVYIELVFLDVVLNFGQGVFSAVIFGLDIKLIIMPLMKSWRRLVHGASTVKLPPVEDMHPKTKQVCEQFSTYHMDKCIKDIVRDRKWRLEELSSVFAGTELVDWLLLVGLAHDRTDAVKYGRRLLLGRVIRHTEDLHHFHDQPLFYTFRQKGE